jgi:hypothetical protein
MAIRTTAGAVQQILGKNYGVLPDGSPPSLTPYVRAGNSLANAMVVCATRKGLTHSTSDLELIECWLAAWAYTKMDPTYSSQTTRGAGGVYDNDPKERERYKHMALTLDTTGCLAAILAGGGKRASGSWLGRVPSEQTEVWYRD